MDQLPFGSKAKDFIWASGIEDTFVIQSRPGHRPLDEYALIGHYTHWRRDLAVARELGLQALRWGVPWHRVEPRPGRFDWRWVDRVLAYLVQELGIEPIIDLVHYGCPRWLERQFDHPAYPDAVAAYAASFAERYQSLVQWYTPLNEPVINAWMCGHRGVWPPYLRGDRGHVRVMLQVARGIVQTVAAIRAVDSTARFVHVDAAGHSHAGCPPVAMATEQKRLQNLLGYELIAGQVNAEHPLRGWLDAHGAQPGELEWLADHPVRLDIIGLNFYPQWSTRQVELDRLGRRYYRPIDKAGTGFAALVEDYFDRYRAPIMITETSARGTAAVRSAWLAHSITAIKDLRRRGVPVIGYTWFPLFTMVNWSYRFGTRPPDAYHLDLGLYTLGAPGQDRWQPTPLVEQFRCYVQQPEEAVGSLESAFPAYVTADDA